MANIILAVTGASGSVYGLSLIKELLKTGNTVHLIFSDNGKKVSEYEKNDMYAEILAESAKNPALKLYDNEDLFAPIASGSFKTDAMVVIPCSMGTLAEISSGISKSLITRAADVCLKERRTLIIAPRETPLNSIHLENMTRLSRAGAIIMPAMPSFYSKPETLEDIINGFVGRVLDMLKIDNSLIHRWGSEK